MGKFHLIHVFIKAVPRKHQKHDQLLIIFGDDQVEDAIYLKKWNLMVFGWMV